jgi:two-component system chemotaxis response regulator CheY
VSHRHHVVILEDDRDTADALGVLLSSFGCEALVATEGHEALDHLRRDTDVCVILLDLEIPDMTSVEFHGHLETVPRFAAIPVVVVSGDAHLAERAAELGAVDQLCKPFDVGSVMRAVERACARRGTAPPRRSED